MYLPWIAPMEYYSNVWTHLLVQNEWVCMSRLFAGTGHVHFE